MTSQDRDFEDIVRGALSAAAESIEPAGDGLQKIRHRLNSPRSARSALTRFTGWFLLLRIRLAVRLEPVTGIARPSLNRAERLAPGAHSGRGAARSPARHRSAPSRLRRAQPWLRPVLAVSAVFAIVMVGVVTLRTVQQTVLSPASSVGSPGARHTGTHPGTAASPGLTPLWVNPSQPSGQTSRQKGLPVAPVVVTTPKPTRSASTASSPSPTASATTPNPTTSPSDTSAPTPTPTPTDSGSSPSATPTPTDSSGTGTSGTGSSGTGSSPGASS